MEAAEADDGKQCAEPCVVDVRLLVKLSELSFEKRIAGMSKKCEDVSHYASPPSLVRVDRATDASEGRAGQTRTSTTRGGKGGNSMPESAASPLAPEPTHGLFCRQEITDHRRSVEPLDRLWHRQGLPRKGAELAFSYVGERFKDRITEFAADFGSTLIFDCDVGDDAQIDKLFKACRRAWPKFDGFVHSIGYAPREAIAGDFLEGLSREGFRIAHDISAYSFPAHGQGRPALPEDKSALLTLTYLGAMRTVPNYNTMGLAKASLEASVRYLAEASAPRACASTASAPGRSRPWPPAASRTSARSSASWPSHSPIRRNVTIEDVGNVAAFLLSDLAAGVTAEIIYVDGGFSQDGADAESKVSFSGLDRNPCARRIPTSPG